MDCAVIEGTITKLTAQLCKTNPELDFEEVRGAARVEAADLIRTFDPARAKLSTYLWHTVWHRLLSRLRSKVWRQRHAVQSAGNLPDMAVKEEFSLSKLLWEVSEEAAGVILLALDCEGKLALAKTLKEAGWDKAKIRAVYNEIREAIFQ
jgi:DNA-directed RNA polymerase specialized sigma24 family protein